MAANAVENDRSSVESVEDLRLVFAVSSRDGIARVDACGFYFAVFAPKKQKECGAHVIFSEIGEDGNVTGRLVARPISTVFTSYALALSECQRINASRAAEPKKRQRGKK